MEDMILIIDKKRTILEYLKKLDVKIVYNFNDLVFLTVEVEKRSD